MVTANSLKIPSLSIQNISGPLVLWSLQKQPLHHQYVGISRPYAAQNISSDFIKPLANGFVFLEHPPVLKTHTALVL